MYPAYLNEPQEVIKIKTGSGHRPPAKRSSRRGVPQETREGGCGSDNTTHWIEILPFQTLSPYLNLDPLLTPEADFLPLGHTSSQ